MKARIELVIRDAEGNILSQLDSYSMELGAQSLHEKRRSSRKLETETAAGCEAQNYCTMHRLNLPNSQKNSELSCNGITDVWIKTVHGKFQFRLQKYLVKEKRTNYLELTKQLEAGYISYCLQELCGYYSNRLSYEEVALLIERVSGERLLSDQKIS